MKLFEEFRQRSQSLEELGACGCNDVENKARRDNRSARNEVQVRREVKRSTETANFV